MCAFIDPAVSSTLHYEKWIRRQSITRYESPTPLHFKALDSVDIPDLSAPDWHIIERDFAMSATRPYGQKKLPSTFIECCS